MSYPNDPNVTYDRSLLSRVPDPTRAEKQVRSPHSLYSMVFNLCPVVPDPVSVPMTVPSSIPHLPRSHPLLTVSLSPFDRRATTLIYWTKAAFVARPPLQIPGPFRQTSNHSQMAIAPAPGPLPRKGSWRMVPSPPPSQSGRGIAPDGGLRRSSSSSLSSAPLLAA